MHNAARVDVLERIEYAKSNVDGSLPGELRFRRKDVAQEPSRDPLHDHVGARAVRIREGPHDVGVVEGGTDFLFSPKSFEKGGVAGSLRNFDRDFSTVSEIGSSINGSHDALGDAGVKAKGIEHADRVGRGSGVVSGV